jgi:hypothetical protein
MVASHLSCMPTSSIPQSELAFHQQSLVGKGAIEYLKLILKEAQRMFGNGKLDSESPFFNSQTSVPHIQFPSGEAIQLVLK